MGAYYIVLGVVVAVVALLGGLSVYSRGLISKHSHGLVASGEGVKSEGGDVTTINERSKLRMKEGLARGRKEMRVLLFTAHPDDETMFFGPTLLALGQKYSKEDYEVTLYMHCLSKGMNCGNVRLEEMKKAAPLYGVPEERLIVDDLEDGDNWSVEEVAKRLMRTIKRWRIDVVLTFDEGGVSGHKNHIQCHAGALFLANECTVHNRSSSSMASFLLEEDDESEPEDESTLVPKAGGGGKGSLGFSSRRSSKREGDELDFDYSRDSFSRDSFDSSRDSSRDSFGFGSSRASPSPSSSNAASHSSSERPGSSHSPHSCASHSSFFPRIYTLRTTPIHVKYASHLTFPLALSAAEHGRNRSTTEIGEKEDGSKRTSSLPSTASPSTSSSTSPQSSSSLLFSNPNPLTVHHGMLAHASQYVWFRRLYIIFSQYVFYNTLDPLAFSQAS